MSDLQGLTLAVVGAGAVGLTLAVRAAQAGARTTAYGAGAATASASSVAAGMLAPAFEALLDAGTADHFEILRAARDAWPSLIAALDLPAATLDRSGAVRVGWGKDEPTLPALQLEMQAFGATCERLDASALKGLQPGLSWRVAEGLFTPEDWRIDPIDLLAALEAALHRNGGRRVEVEAALDAAGRFVVDGAVIAADAIVVAAGPGALAWRSEIPELAALHPIKGQILTFDAPPCSGPVVRGPQGYVTPQPRGARVGATMETGRTDLATDAATVERLRASAVDLFPALATAPLRASAGVRVATADGLPLVGASQVPGVYLAVGARRNGWLLAPLMAQEIVDALSGRGSPDAGPLRASRFMA